MYTQVVRLVEFKADTRTGTEDKKTGRKAPPR